MRSFHVACFRFEYATVPAWMVVCPVPVLSLPVPVANEMPVLDEMPVPDDVPVLNEMPVPDVPVPGQVPDLASHN
jgi:hypothetical protein